MMRRPDLVLYLEEGRPLRLLQVDAEQCVAHLSPFLKSCRERQRTSEVVAEIEFSTGLFIWFSGKDGAITIHEERPRIAFGQRWSRYLAPLIKRDQKADVTDEKIAEVVFAAFQGTAEPGAVGNEGYRSAD